MNISEEKFQQWQKSDATIHKMFRSAVNETPNKLALVDGDVSITYLELDKLTDGLAGYLQANGVKKNQIVGVYLEKCYEYIVSCLAILKAGGTYLHLDLDYPSEIIEKIVEETSPIAIISKSNHLSRLPACDSNKVLIDEMVDLDLTGYKLNTAHSTDSSEIAFVGYTSGTTGIPKGVRVSHMAAIYSISKFWQEIWHLPNIKEFGYATYLSWDAMGPLMFNATGHIIPDDINHNSLSLVTYIMEHKINHTFFTPSLLKAIFQEVPENVLKKTLADLNVIWLGGEVTTRELLEETYEILPNVHLINNYGPSECFVVAQGPLTNHDINIDSLLCPVGRVLPEMGVLIFNDKLQETMPGITGELYVTGPCLADGYMNNPDLTREKFISLHGNIYFKTGDLAYFMRDGRLVIQGRTDFVVNMGNHSINLLEVQSNIKKLLPIIDCVVVYVEDINKNSHLVCFLVKSPEISWEVDPAHIKSILISALPKYMIPKKYIEINKIPVNCTSQKINYKQLRKLASN